MRSFSRSHKITIVGGYLCSHWSEENTGIKQIPIIGIKKIPWGIGIFCEDRELRCIYLPNLNLNFNSTQKDEETELHTTADKEDVDVQLAVEQEKPIAVLLKQEIDALQRLLAPIILKSLVRPQNDGNVVLVANVLEEEEASFDDVDLNEAIEDKTSTVGSKKNLLW